MTKLALLISFLSFFSCHKAQDATVTPATNDNRQLIPNADTSVKSAKARLTNYAAVDGCGYTVVLSGQTATSSVEYTPSGNTFTRVDSLAQAVGFSNGVFDKPVTVTYKQTGYSVERRCGFGTPFQATEIDVIAIRPAN